VAIEGKIAIGRNRQRQRSTAVIREPRMPAIPRFIVSTSGNSGIGRD
jgi:hypothetical protein